MQELCGWDIFRALKERHPLLAKPFFNSGICGVFTSCKVILVTSAGFMGKAVRPLTTLFCLSSSLWVAAQDPSTQDRLAPAIIPLDQVHEGMKGTALTVFQGVKPESMDVEVLGGMHNVKGPRGDIIRVRLPVPKPETQGVVAGITR